MIRGYRVRGYRDAEGSERRKKEQMRQLEGVGDQEGCDTLKCS